MVIQTYNIVLLTKEEIILYQFNKRYEEQFKYPDEEFV